MTVQHVGMKNILSLLLFSFFTGGLAGCSSAQTESGQDPIVRGQITVDSELDSTGDYSGIELLVAQTLAGGQRDTLFYSTTDSSGQYYGIANINESGLYPMFVSRNNQPFGIFNIVIAEGDTVTFNGQLPNINDTATIESHENDIYDKYGRLQRSFQRVANYVNTRGMSTDSVEAEIMKWSDLFWDLHKSNQDTYAGERAAAASASMLEGWDNDRMLARTDSIMTQYNSLPDGLRSQLTLFYASRDSLERSVEFLTQIENMLSEDDQKLAVRQELIKLLFDSARTDRAEELLAEFKETYTGNPSAVEWADRMDYDISTLAPGKPFPEFSFLDSVGQTVSSETLEDTPYMIEFTRFDNPLYQQQYEQVVALYQVYRNYGLKVITVPIGANDVVFNAFFEERGMFWDVADPESFYAEELRIQYNLNRLPTRFLVNSQGNIVQRYEGTEFDRIIQGLQKTLTQQQTES
jgi:glutathione peroxidase-family protein